MGVQNDRHLPIGRIPNGPRCGGVGGRAADRRTTWQLSCPEARLCPARWRVRRSAVGAFPGRGRAPGRAGRSVHQLSSAGDGDDGPGNWSGWSGSSVGTAVAGPNRNAQAIVPAGTAWRACSRGPIRAHRSRGCSRVCRFSRSPTRISGWAALLSERDETCAAELAIHSRCHRAGNGSCSAGSGTRLTAGSRSGRPAFWPRRIGRLRSPSRGFVCREA